VTSSILRTQVTDGDARDGWSGELWQQMAPVYSAVLGHPFVTGLTDGTLPWSAFRYYLRQDALYLRSHARTLAVVAAKAPDHLDTATLARHAGGAVQAELTLHTSLLGSADGNGGPNDGADDCAGDAGPTTTAYTSYLSAAAYGGTFAEGLAAVLPCYWIYERVGNHLAQHGSPDPRYQQWIDTYAGDEFSAVVAEVLNIVDRTGAALSSREREVARHHAMTAARYEWMFWDAAYREEIWPIQ
jgi:thiaminase/transcriptional activator TenA